MSLFEQLLTSLSLLNDPINLVKTVGYIGLFVIIFSETGLLFGFFLPGDSLLVSAGLLASYGYLSVEYLLVSLSIAAIAGDAVGFFIGHKLGGLLYLRKDSFFFRKKHLEMARDFYEKHGGKTIIFARFIPIVRTFAPTVAGTVRMDKKKFFSYNVFGGIGWIFSTILGGYYLGKIFGEKLQNYIHYLIIGIILLSISPLIYKWIKIKMEKSK